MWREYAPEPRMRLNLGIRRRLAPLLDNDRRKIELANSLLFTLPGSPIIYYGDEIGMGDNIWLDDRNGVRTPMQWADAPNAGFSPASPERLYLPVIASPGSDPAQINVASQQADPHSLYQTVRRMVAIRKGHPAFGGGALEWAPGEDRSILAFYIAAPQERILAVHNLSGEQKSFPVALPGAGPQSLVDLLTGQAIQVQAGAPAVLTLPPYGYTWRKAK